MPVAFLIPLASAALTAVGAPLSLAAGAGFGFAVGSEVLATAIQVAAVAVGSYVLNRLSQPSQKNQPGQVQVKQSLPARRVIFGRDKVAGPVFFLAVSTGAAVYRGTILSEGPIDAIEQTWLNDKDAGVPGGNGPCTIDPWGGKVTFEASLGALDQAASGKLLAGFPGQWTGQHRLVGTAWLVMQCDNVKKEKFQKTYPNFVPNERVVARGVKVLDLRYGTTVWTDNAALIVLHLMTDPVRGLGIPFDEIDAQSFHDMADLCDEAVPQYDGSWASRYRCGGTYTLADPPRDVLTRLLQACDGELVLTPQGTWALRGGRWTEPVVTLTDRCILEIAYEQGNDKLESVNRFKLSYVDPRQDFQVIETTPWEDSDSIAERGEVLQQDLTLNYVQDHSQARRLAKIAMFKANPRHKITLTCSVEALGVWGERMVRLNSAALGIDDTFRLVSIAAAADLSTVTLGIEHLPSAAYGWTGAAEEGPPPPVPTNIRNVAVPPAPTGLTLTIKGTTAGTPPIALKRIRMTEATPAGDWYQFAGRIRTQGSTTWTAMPADGDWAVLQADLVTPGMLYDIQAANVSGSGLDGAAEIIGVGSDWISPLVAPAAVTGLTATPSGGSVLLSWTNPPADNLYWIEVWSSDSGTNTKIATLYDPQPSTAQSTTITAPGAGTHYYFLRSVSPTGRARPSGTVGVTV